MQGRTEIHCSQARWRVGSRQNTFLTVFLFPLHPANYNCPCRNPLQTSHLSHIVTTQAARVWPSLRCNHVWPLELPTFAIHWQWLAKEKLTNTEFPLLNDLHFCTGETLYMPRGVVWGPRGRNYCDNSFAASFIHLLALFDLAQLQLSLPNKGRDHTQNTRRPALIPSNHEPPGSDG